MKTFWLDSATTARKEKRSRIRQPSKQSSSEINPTLDNPTKQADQKVEKSNPAKQVDQKSEKSNPAKQVDQKVDKLNPTKQTDQKVEKSNPK